MDEKCSSLKFQKNIENNNLMKKYIKSLVQDFKETKNALSNLIDSNNISFRFGKKQLEMEIIDF